MSSDIDFVILTVDQASYVDDDVWVRDAVGQAAPMVRTMTWGPISERRVRLASGFEVEFGFGPPSWASTEPLDPGTAQVVRDGCLVLSDPGGALARLVMTVNGAGPESGLARGPGGTCCSDPA
jgi:hypothetical protein